MTTRGVRGNDEAVLSETSSFAGEVRITGTSKALQARGAGTITDRSSRIAINL
jgi:hypothetical protein